MIRRRLQKLEKILAPRLQKDAGWGSMAACRDQLLHDSRERGDPFVAHLENQLEAMGPLGLWREAARNYLKDHGFVQQAQESLAETTARALGIGVSQLRVCMGEGRLVTELIRRVGELKAATDNG